MTNCIVVEISNKGTELSYFQARNVQLLCMAYGTCALVWVWPANPLHGKVSGDKCGGQLC